MNKLEKLVEVSLREGATRAKIIDVGSIVMDRRVLLKCQVPPCDGYNRYYFCPPNSIPFDEFRKILSKYKKAIFIQLEMENVDSLDKSNEPISKNLVDKLEKEVYEKYELKLHEIVNAVEREAFKLGYYLATGLIGGNCKLCEECADPKKGELCHQPFKARPSLEGVGIDVYRTCKNIGMPLGLSSQENVRWNGLVLVE
jgi:predicted metal-binding protein